MKEISSGINDLVKDPGFKADFNNLLSTSSKETYGSTSLLESNQKFNIISEILTTAFTTQELDLLSSKMLNQIFTGLSNVHSYSGNAIQLIIHIDDLYDIIMSSGLMNRIINKRDYSKELKELANLRAELDTTVRYFREIKTISDEIKRYQDEILGINKEAKDILNEVIEKQSSANLYTASINEHKKDAETTLGSIVESEKDIEVKKLSITTFSENIDEYKKSIELLEGKAKLIIAKDEKISQLITDAETALNLKSAQGISAAFSSQYSESKNSSLGWWIFGAVFFFIGALAMTIWIVSGYHIKDPTSWSSIIGRIVAVGITISAATFCANQYRRQKALSEDYAYKAVLSKSIVAFTHEIKKQDANKVSDYLSKVLDEIHKDPQRSRTKKTKLPKLNAQALLEKTIEKIPNAK